MAERFKAPVLKTDVGKPTGGSNPSPSASLSNSIAGLRFDRLFESFPNVETRCDPWRIRSGQQTQNPRESRRPIQHHSVTKKVLDVQRCVRHSFRKSLGSECSGPCGSLGWIPLREDNLTNPTYKRLQPMRHYHSTSELRKASQPACGAVNK
jgi:hypothetical protein